MAHEHLHFKEDIAAEHTHSKQIRVSIALLGTLAGFMLLLSSGVAGSKYLYGSGRFQAEFLAIAGAIMLGARASIESLIKLTPTTANLIDERGIEKEVTVSSLKPGDSVRVRPGDNIPADGEVIKGLSSVNEATITGESLPVDKVPGMQVFAGTSNLTGALDITVTKAGKDTTLGKVQSLIIQAEKTQLPIMRMIDQIGRASCRE